MHILCTIRAGRGTLPDSLGKTLVSHGWEPAGDGGYSRAFPAGPSSVDAPAIALHAMLTGTLAGDRAEGFVGEILRVDCRYRDVEVFTDAVRAVCGTDGAALSWDSDSPPFFSDLLRLRDKILASVQLVSRRENPPGAESC